MKRIVALYLVSAVLFILTFVGFNMGMDRINFNIGITPLIAFPVAVVAIFAAICFFNKAERLRSEYEEQEYRSKQ